MHFEKLGRITTDCGTSTAPNILNSIFDAVSSRLSTNNLTVTTARISTEVTEDQYAAQEPRCDKRRTEQSEARNLIATLDKSKD
jgi:hypothetical protein